MMENNGTNNIHASTRPELKSQEMGHFSALTDLFTFMQKIEYQPIILKCLTNNTFQKGSVTLNNRERMALLLLIQKLESAFTEHPFSKKAETVIESNQP